MEICNKKYEFEPLKQRNDYIYHSGIKFDKKTQVPYYCSFVSYAEDLNKSTIAKLEKHKRVIDLAIKMVESQYKGGQRWPAISFPKQLIATYHWHVYKHVVSKLKDKKETGFGSQPYWIYSKHLVTYAFRKKDLGSKFQCFVEFVPSYSSEETIKVNLRMNKRTYENRDKLFLDGLDLVYSEECVKVRHISKQFVSYKEYNGIEKHLFIDAWSNIHTGLINKNPDNVDEEGRPRYNEETKVACGIQNVLRNTKFVKDRINLIKSCKNSKKYGEYLNSLIPSIKAKVEAEIGKDNETLIILNCPLDNDSVLFNDIVSIFYKEVLNHCAKLGIRVKVVNKSMEQLREKLQKHKARSNKYIEKVGYGKTNDLNASIKWHEYMYACFMFEYDGFYPILKRGGKFLVNPFKNTDGKEHQVQYPLKPKYPYWSAFQITYAKLFGADYSESYTRSMYLDTIKNIANEYAEEFFKLNPELYKEDKSTEYYETQDDVVFV